MKSVCSMQILARRTLDHCSEHLIELAPWLLQTTGGDAQQLKVGLEVPHGPLVLASQAHNLEVFSINPLQSNRFRDQQRCFSIRSSTDRTTASATHLGS